MREKEAGTERGSSWEEEGTKGENHGRREDEASKNRRGKKPTQQPPMALSLPYTLLSVTPLNGCQAGLVTMSKDTVGLARPMT